jgi:hypothetical protein
MSNHEADSEPGRRSGARSRLPNHELDLDTRTESDNLPLLLEAVHHTHRERPAHYYLGAGPVEGRSQCRQVLLSLKSISSAALPAFLKCDEAIPFHPLFTIIKRHLDVVRVYYGEKEPSLLRVFMCSLLQTHPAPLRSSILTSISLFSTRVYVHDDKLQPMPVAAHIDGHFDLVVELAENSIRIPLILGGQQLAEQPRALRFRAGDLEGQRKLAKYIFETAPEKGRETQLRTFVSFLNSGRRPDSFVGSFGNALLSFDLSFATAVCALASRAPDLVISRLLFKLLVSNEMIDHFLRCAAVEIVNAVAGYQVQHRPELYAIVNLFIAQAARWIVERKPHENVQDIPGLVSRIRLALQDHELPDEAHYILRAVLTMAAYVNEIAVTTVFLEIAVRPFVPTELDPEFYDARQRIFMSDPETQRSDRALNALIREIQASIIIALTANSQIRVMGGDLNEEKFRILQFVCEERNLEPFVELVIDLNARKKKEHPIVQMIAFVYRKGIELGKHTQMGQEETMRTLTLATTRGHPRTANTMSTFRLS